MVRCVEKDAEASEVESHPVYYTDSCKSVEGSEK